MVIWVYWIILQCQFLEGRPDCLSDLEDYPPYTGQISITNNGFTCQAWASQTPNEHNILEEDLEYTGETLKDAKNYCREIGDIGRPWCYTNHPDIRWEYCTYSICTEYNQDCIKEILQNTTGVVDAPDSDSDGLYNPNMGCVWIVHAPNGYVIRYVLVYFEIEMEDEYCSDFLLIFEKAHATEEQFYCGKSSIPVEGETMTNTLYVNFFSDSTIEMKGFRLTYRLVEAPSKDCGGKLMSYSGWITSPDYDNDGLYDFNINCTWILEANDSITFEIQYLQMEASEGCNADHLKILGKDEIIVKTCGTYEDVASFKTTSDILTVIFVSDHLYNGRGFNFSYKVSGNRCLNSLLGHSPDVSVTNNGFECQAWADQFPHAHIYNDSYFTSDGSAKRAGNFCRDIGVPGMLWCVTTNPDIRWDYCTFSACNITSDCGGLVEGNYGFVSSPDIQFTQNFDCLWWIQADEKQRLFEKGSTFYCEDFCSKTNFSTVGEIKSDVLYIHYYSDSRVENVVFSLLFITTDAFDKNCDEAFTEPGEIVPPKMDGYFYGFNLDCRWNISGPEDTFISFNLIDVDIEVSDKCASDFISFFDDAGIVFDKLCGQHSSLHLISRTNRTYVHFVTDSLNSGTGFTLKYEMVASGHISTMHTTDGTSGIPAETTARGFSTPPTTLTLTQTLPSATSATEPVTTDLTTLPVVATRYTIETHTENDIMNSTEKSSVTSTKKSNHSTKELETFSKRMTPTTSAGKMSTTTVDRTTPEQKTKTKPEASSTTEHETSSKEAEKITQAPETSTKHAGKTTPAKEPTGDRNQKNTKSQAPETSIKHVTKTTPAKESTGDRNQKNTKLQAPETSIKHVTKTIPAKEPTTGDRNQTAMKSQAPDATKTTLAEEPSEGDRNQTTTKPTSSTVVKPTTATYATTTSGQKREIYSDESTKVPTVPLNKSAKHSSVVPGMLMTTESSKANPRARLGFLTRWLCSIVFYILYTGIEKQ